MMNEMLHEEYLSTHIVSGTQRDLRSPIPSHGDILCHEVLAIGLQTSFSKQVPSCEAKVTDFQFTIGVDEEIGRFEVPMENICGVNVIQAA